ncbi:AraC family transcriptional regulator [Kordia sp. SMS9]|uniref:AraC family transcriptional regulator n=1 Tax=Kordia sp. SMS9 TaxID=2282170 RepID=UPI0013B414F1|nr:AraC family transcriptional regulator [Kordia sp. SMS9]
MYDTTFYEDPAKANMYAAAAYELAKKNGDQEKLVIAKYYVARSKYYLTKYSESTKDLEEVIRIATEISDNVLLYKSHSLKGNNLFEQNKHHESLDLYLKAKKYAKLTDNPLFIARINISIAFIKKFHKDYEEAINVLLENLKLLEQYDGDEKKKKNNQRTVLMQLADTYLRIKKPKEAEHYNDLALKLSPKEEFHDAYYWGFMNKAIIEYQNKNFEKSIEYSRQVETYYKNTNKLSNLATPYFYIGKSFYELGNNSQAVEYLEKAIAISDEFKLDFQEKKEVYRYLDLAHSLLGNSKKANEYSIMFYELDKKNDSLDIALNNRINKEHDIIPLQEEIESLDKNTKYLYVFSGILLTILVSFFIWFKQRQKRNKKRFQELLITIEKLEQPKKKNSQKIIPKETSNTVTDKNALQILKDLEKFEEKEFYLRKDCTLSYVAKKLKTNTTYLSNVINTHKEKSFKSYLSELRINAALIQLKNNPKLRSYTVKAIAEEFGFKRPETFSRAFKTQTNMYPSNYIKNLENQQIT